MVGSTDTLCVSAWTRRVLARWHVAGVLVWVRLATSLFPGWDWLLPRTFATGSVITDAQSVAWLFPDGQEHFGVWWGPNTRRDIRTARARQLWAYRMFTDRHVTATQWERVLRDTEARRLPSGMMMDPRLPEYLAVQLVDEPWHWSRLDGAEGFVDRQDVRSAAPTRMWRFLLSCAPSAVALRAADRLVSFTDEDVRGVLSRRDKGWMVGCLLMSHAEVFTPQQWELLLADFRSSWEVVRDARLSEAVIARYAGSSFPGVVRAIAENERFSETLRIQASLSLTSVTLS